MKYLLVTFLFAASSQSTLGFAAETPVELKYSFSSPVLSPELIVKLSEKYIANEKHIDLNRYFLRSLSFGFYNSNGKYEGAQNDSKWYVSYQCKPVNDLIAVGCDFRLTISNSENPEIVFIGGK